MTMIKGYIKNNNLTMFKKFILLLNLIMIFLVILFSISASFNHPVSDAFFYIYNFVMPFEAGSLTIKDFFSNNTSHSHVLYKIFIIINYKYFHLNSNIELFFGLIGFFFSFIIICHTYLNEKKENSYVKYIVFLLISIKFLSFNETVQYSWQLVTFEYWFLAFSLLSFYFFGNYLKTNNHKFYLYASLFLSLLFGSSLGILAIFIIFFMTLVVLSFSAINKGIRRQELYVLIGYILGLILLYKFVLSNTSGNSSLTNSEIYDINNIIYIIKFLGNGLISISHYKHVDNVGNISLFIGLTVVFINTYSIYSIFKYKLYNKHLFTICILLLSYFITLGIYISRTPVFGAEYISNSLRYVRFSELNVISNLWILSLIYHQSIKKNKLLVNSILVYLVVIIVSSQLIFTKESFNKIKYLNKYHKLEEKELRFLSEGKINNLSMPRIKKEYTYEVINFCKRKNVSLFAGEF